jgi:hypothetical protein
VKRLTCLLLALFLACEKDEESTANGLPSDEVAWLHISYSRPSWMIIGTDDSLRFASPGRRIYGEEGCVESAISYALREGSLVFRPDMENEMAYSIALLDSGRILRQSYEGGDSRWYGDFSLAEPLDCEAYEALPGIDGQYAGSGLLLQGGVLLDSLELRVWAENGFLWIRTYNQAPIFSLGARTQPGANTVLLLAGAGTYSGDGETYFLDNGQLALESFSTETVSGVFTGLFYDRDTRSNGAYAADISLQMVFETVATTFEAAPRPETTPWENAGFRVP